MYGKINRMEQSPGVCEVLQPSAPKERMTALENKCAIKMENITKRFGKVVANNAINMELREGEILSLLGENGSGKTTLMNMLSGIYFPDEGQIYIHDKPVTIASPKDAFALGIGMIHQHFKLVDLFTATENIILGLEGKLDLANARKKVQARSSMRRSVPSSRTPVRSPSCSASSFMPKRSQREIMPSRELVKNSVTARRSASDTERPAAVRRTSDLVQA